MSKPSTEAAGRADFSIIRYAQVWEDADILLDALNIGSESVCLSIASAGDNALALLTRQPKKVYALDLNPAQLHCLALRVAGFRILEYGELLELLGVRESDRREALYARCLSELSEDARTFWDAHKHLIAQGIAHVGKFEHYFALFRRRIMPLIHSRSTVQELLAQGTAEERRTFYQKRWNNLRWRTLFKLFFSRFTMGRLGRDPAFFRYVKGSVADCILERTRYAMTELSPAENPYLQWILLGQFSTALPVYLRPENFDTIRNNIDRLEWRLASVEQFTESLATETLDAANLSDIFEYMSEENTERLLRQLHRVCNNGARLAYWNMLAPRSRPDCMAAQLNPLPELSDTLFGQDKAFFYSRFVVEEVIQ